MKFIGKWRKVCRRLEAAAGQLGFLLFRSEGFLFGLFWFEGVRPNPLGSRGWETAYKL